MCFGDSSTGSKATNTSSTANPAVSGAATGNLEFAQNLQKQGFTPYGGQFVAPFSGQQQTSFGMADALGQTPAIGQASNYINNYGSAGPGSVDASTIASKMNPYMNAYVQQSLAPQLENLNQQFAGQDRQAASQSTMAGAFGNDAQDAIYRSNLKNQQNIGLSGLVGNAYNSAFNTAIGAGAQDVSNNLNAQTTNAGLRETALNREAGAATGLQGLIGTQSNLAGLENTFGQQQTAASQADFNAKYNEALQARQYPFQTTQLVNQTVGAGAQAMPASTSSTATEYKPNNIGYQIGSAALGAFLADGGPAPAGMEAMVGERGPELFKPNDPKEKPHLIGKQGPEVIKPKKSGTVIPHEALATKQKEKAAKTHQKPQHPPKPQQKQPSSPMEQSLGMAA